MFVIWDLDWSGVLSGSVSDSMSVSLFSFVMFGQDPGCRQMVIPETLGADLGVFGVG